MQKTKSVWLNGKLANWDDAVFHVASDSLACGLAVFEDVPCFSGAAGSFAFRVADHVKQFARSAKIADMRLPYTEDKLAKAVVKVATSCGLASGTVHMAAFYAGAPCGNCDEAVDGNADALRAEGGGDADGQAVVSVALYCEPGQSVSAEPVSACVSSWRALSNNALPPQAELAAVRANAAFALRDARRCGFDQAILLSEAGDVCSGTGRALFAVRDGVLSTPPVACGVRESVERDTVINFAMDLDVPIVEERITRADLYISDEVVFCDAECGVLPVSAVDGREIGKAGAVGPITKAIQERFAKMVDSKLDEYRAWASEIALPQQAEEEPCPSK